LIAFEQVALMQKRKRLLEQGEADPSSRRSLQPELRKLNQRILQTPALNYHDASYTRVKFLRYADDVAVGVIGPKALAEQVKQEIGDFLREKLRLELNEEKTHILHLPTEKERFLGYEFKMALTTTAVQAEPTGKRIAPQRGTDGQNRVRQHHAAGAAQRAIQEAAEVHGERATG
jgi:hypothetical protein